MLCPTIVQSEKRQWQKKFRSFHSVLVLFFTLPAFVEKAVQVVSNRELVFPALFN